MLYPLSYEGGMTHSDATGTCRAPCLRAQRCGMKAADLATWLTERIQLNI